MKKTTMTQQTKIPGKEPDIPVISMEKYLRSRQRSLFRAPVPNEKEEKASLFYTQPIFKAKRNDPL